MMVFFPDKSNTPLFFNAPQAKQFRNQIQLNRHSSACSVYFHREHIIGTPIIPFVQHEYRLHRRLLKFFFKQMSQKIA